jgi:ABC-type bacteriocin/lantibiotic exporter with double-glycine peptidase domain
MKAIVQQEKTGCGIACFAMLADISYSKAKTVAQELGIFASDSKLWSDSGYILKLCAEYKIKVGKDKTPFKDWSSLPDRALLATKWHQFNQQAFWHWSVFVREQGEKLVLDPSQNIKNNRRTDLGRIKPKWFLEIKD